MRKGLITLLLVIMFGLTVFGLNAYNKEPLYHSQSYIFGTMVDISIYGETPERARLVSNQILEDFQNLHHQLHAWKTTTGNQLNELGILNQTFSQGKDPSIVTPQLANMLSEATALSVKSQGLFNPAIGHLISTWGFQRDEFSAVNIDDKNIKALVEKNPKMTDIVIESQHVYSNNPVVKIDLGGYAKGYALDMAANYLRKQQVKNALVNIGGNIIALGKHGASPWRVGIQHPRQPVAIATIDLPNGWAIGTSGDYQRFFTLNGKRYCHLIDPRTGYPVSHTQSVSVLIPPQASNTYQAGVLSDVASKPIFIEPAENKIKAAMLFNIKHFMYIDQQSRIFVSKDMAKKLHWVDDHAKFFTLP